GGRLAVRIKVIDGGGSARPARLVWQVPAMDAGKQERPRGIGGEEQSRNLLRSSGRFVCVVSGEKGFGRASSSSGAAKKNRHANRARWSPTFGISAHESLGL